MGGRGRGRGRGAVPPSVASAPFGSAHSNGSPSTTNSGINYSSRTEPSQKFPDILIPEAPNFNNFSEFQLKSAEYSDKIDSLLRMSASFRPIKTSQQKIDRYSDRYLSNKMSLNDQRERERLCLSSIQSNLDFFPEELHSIYQFDPNASKRKKSSVSSNVSFKETLSHLESLAQKEESNNEEEKKPNEEEEEDLGGEELEDEEFEDETDYNFSYFDNGEDGGDHDDGNDEAIF